MLSIPKLKLFNYLVHTRITKTLVGCASLSGCLNRTQEKSSAVQVVLDSNLSNKLSKNEIKPRKHHGINKSSISMIPKRILAAISKSINDFPMRTLVDSSAVFNRFIKARKAPMEEASVKLKMREIETVVDADPKKFKMPQFPEDESNDVTMKQYSARRAQVVEEIAKQRIYSWQTINYDEYKALLYLIGRSAEEYAVITRIFQEIKKRDPNFTPRSYFDFGSGVGTGVWAASEMWNSSIYEYYLVDSSKCMNDLSDLLLRDGDVNKSMFIKNVYYRQFLPAQADKYDIVLSAYSMFELSTLKNRLEISSNLWNKAQRYLIFVESGTNAGFQVLSEIRDFLMEMKEMKQEDAFIFAPCPHESPCPRFKLNDGTPCNFEVAYNTLPLSGPSVYRKDLYSYLVIKKGKPNEDSDRWPRVVRKTLLRHKHSICRMCTDGGKLQEVIFTASKHGKFAYKCAKKSNWGDQLPIKIHETESTEDPSEEKK